MFGRGRVEVMPGGQAALLEQRFVPAFADDPLAFGRVGGHRPHPGRHLRDRVAVIQADPAEFEPDLELVVVGVVEAGESHSPAQIELARAVAGQGPDIGVITDRDHPAILHRDGGTRWHLGGKGRDCAVVDDQVGAEGAGEEAHGGRIVPEGESWNSDTPVFTTKAQRHKGEK